MSGENKQRILIVEDEALVAMELKSRLTQMGWEVAGIAFGVEAIEIARETRPDLLLTDIHLKDGADGIEVAQKICEEMDIPVVFLTAYSDNETVSKAKSVTPFGYIIKPVENRELQITIDMALYKFKIDKELKETQQLLQTALTCIGSALVFVDQAGNVSDLNADARKLLGVESAFGRSWTDLLGQQSGSSIIKMVNSAMSEKGIVRMPPFVVQMADSNLKLVDGIFGPMDTGGVLILRELAEINDSLEKLAEPGQMLSNLGPEVLSPTESSLCQILISPDIAAGDEAEKIVDRLSRQFDHYVRATDLVSIFGGSLLSVSMPYTSVAEGEQIANALLREISSDLRIGEKLSFSIGLAYSVAGDTQPIELFRRAKLALENAQRQGGGVVSIWTEGFEVSADKRNNEIQIEREYRNLVLVWNVMSVLSRASDMDSLALGFCEHLFKFFKLERIALLERQNQALRTVTGFCRQTSEVLSVSDLGLSAQEFHLLDGLFNAGEGEVAESGFCLFSLGANKVLMLDFLDDDESFSISFLRTLVDYFSTGLIRFSPQQVDEAEIELDIDDRMIYESPQVKSIIESARLVAPTDATVLIVGDSGTGKEMLARFVHEASPRSQKPFVIVDCGAVVGSLIESELFGHVRGAFTGADKNFSGRLKEADGGTVLLDEVGELPIDVQVKLLRFVQDREIAAVGSSKYETVDTRVIAATNKDLRQMVDAGSFREDLYYRLNVFAITTPRLNQRPDDIMPLANHYLRLYAQRYNKSGLGFSSEAEQAMLQHQWPGNIRELTNVINRAVILCKDSRVNPIHLGLFSKTEPVLPEKPEAEPVEQFSLRDGLKVMVDRALQSNSSLQAIGQWLEDDLILVCMARHGDVLNRAAITLGIPESTMRRKVNRLKELHGESLPIRPDGWISINELLDELTEICKERGTPLLDMVSRSLVREIEGRNISRQDAAKLMGVSIPTYRRLVS